MKISLNWLKQYVDIPKDLSPKELALKLTMATVEVEAVIDLGKQLDNLYIGQVKKIVKHPDADKLFVAEVDIKKKKIQVIFGTMAEVCEGDIVPVVVAPSALPTGIKVAKQKIRGVVSEGMLCLDSEFMPDGQEVLTYFPRDTKVGSLVKDIMGLDDVIFVLDNKSITHRPDLWGHYGIAREVAAILGKKLKDLNINQKIEGGSEVKLKIKIESQEVCSRYIGAVMGGIKIEPSPLWMQKLLTSVGTRPINNIVDITNYVMLELGRPSHAFDRREVKGDTIIVRNAKPGEKFKTLDNKERKMTTEMCLVCDAKRSIDLGGIMGGENSEIKNDTTEILLELANFNPVNIRKTAQALDLRTEAATRFEKGLDPSLAELGIKRIITLIGEIVPGAKVISKIVDVNYDKDQSRIINLNLDFLNKRLGQDIPKKEVIRILQNLSFKVEDKGELLFVSPPQFRTIKDISIPEDLVEEVARIYGYDNITPVMPKVEMTPPEENRGLAVRRKVKDILTLGCGADEVYNYSFTSSKNLETLKLNPEDHFELKNYLSEDQKYLRVSLFENLIKNLEDNLRFYEELNIFELGRVYAKGEGEYAVDNKKQSFLGKQERKLAGLLASKDKEPFFQVKGIVETLLNGLEIDFSYHESQDTPKWLNNGRYLEIKVSDKVIGWAAEINPAILNQLAIKKSVGVWQLNFELLVKYVQDNKKYQPLPKYPGITYDFSIIVSQEIAWSNIRKEVLGLSQLIKRVELFDVYRLTKLGPDKKSMAFHVYFQDDKKTLTSEEADKLREQIVGLLKRKFGAEIR